jgi:DNA-binding SARP family transcriptional activator
MTVTPRSEPPDGARRASLRTAVGLLASLERHVQDAQALIRELSAQLGDQDECADGWYEAASTAADSAPPGQSAARPAESAQLRLLSLGAFEVYWGDRAIPQLRTGKGRAILKYLAAQPRQRVLRDVLLEVLWPETDPHTANNRLKVAMHHLRQVCAPLDADAGAECVIFRDGCYMFNPSIRVWTDVDAFEAAWRAGAQMQRAGRVAEARTHFTRAEALYRGDFLEEDLFEDWALLRREELKDIYLTVLGKLSQDGFEAGDFERAGEGWRKILVKDPCREDVYRSLMRCCAHCGQRSLALHWYELCARVLEEQLHLEPEPETVMLYRRIRAGQRVDA